jgi:hypothetical protein
MTAFFLHRFFMRWLIHLQHSKTKLYKREDDMAREDRSKKQMHTENKRNQLKQETNKEKDSKQQKENMRSEGSRS